MTKLVLSTAYFPPISYIKLIVNHDQTLIEQYENYIKQTYRNRCIIHASGGELQLSVPVERGSFHKTAIKELKIDYSGNWIRLHLRALNASYNSSAFYEFFIDEIRELLEKRIIYLIDLNNEILRLIFNLIGVEPEIFMTETFIPSYDESDDFRYKLTPKGREGNIITRDLTYFQVFSPENGFISDLSILDLLFNMGPELYNYLNL